MRKSTCEMQRPSHFSDQWTTGTILRRKILGQTNISVRIIMALDHIESTIKITSLTVCCPVCGPEWARGKSSLYNSLTLVIY